MTTDFAFLLKHRIPMALEAQSDGEQLTDSALLEIVKHFGEDSVGEQDYEFIVNDLDQNLSRPRGRPSKNRQTRKQIADQLLSQSHPELPSTFFEGLAGRIASGRRYLVSTARKKSYRQYRSHVRNEILIGLYFRVTQALRLARESIVIPEMARFRFPQSNPNLAISKRALIITQDIAQRRLQMHPPSLRRMENIIAASRSN